MSEEVPVVKMVGITKKFPGVIANNNINFELMKGEIHCLLGENGAGKTTLMNILYGLYNKDAGEIYVYGKKVDIKSPAEALELNIGMIHQHCKLIESMSVVENIILGSKKEGIIIDTRGVEEKIRKIMVDCGLRVDPKAKIWQLSASERQRAEILKMLYLGVNILILDEPTSNLSPPEVAELFKFLRQLKSKGYSIILITHKAQEVKEIADSITVLRGGKVVANLRKAELKEMSIKELSSLMVGKEVSFSQKKRRLDNSSYVLEVVNLKACNDKGQLALKGVSFSVKKGEIFGIAGVGGNGQRELVETIIGVRKAVDGKVIVEGKDLTKSSPCERIKEGICYVPEDRIRVGVALDSTVYENLILGRHRDEQFLYNWFLPSRNLKIFMNRDKLREYAQKLISEYDIKTPSETCEAKLLSGGNLQRLILARAFSTDFKVLVCEQPTRGLDIIATEFIHSKLIEFANKRKAVILVSTDLDEILKLSDRIAVMYEGEIMGVTSAEKTNKEEIGLMMVGKRLEEFQKDEL